MGRPSGMCADIKSKRPCCAKFAPSSHIDRKYILSVWSERSLSLSVCICFSFSRQTMGEWGLYWCGWGWGPVDIPNKQPKIHKKKTLRITSEWHRRVARVFAPSLLLYQHAAYTSMTIWHHKVAPYCGVLQGPVRIPKWYLKSAGSLLQYNTHCYLYIQTNESV